MACFTLNSFLSKWSGAKGLCSSYVSSSEYKDDRELDRKVIKFTWAKDYSRINSMMLVFIQAKQLTKKRLVHLPSSKKRPFRFFIIIVDNYGIFFKVAILDKSKFPAGHH